MPKVVFVHPDLGIGGAERLVVDAALALQQKGHSVHILTSHHNSDHCFEETRDGTVPVTVYGDWLPRNIFGYFYALCAYVRMLYVSICLLLSKQFDPDVIFTDQVSIPIPILKRKTPNIIFYCHFPDLLLSKPGGFLKNFYRGPLNWLEEYTTGQAMKVFVNSKFTSEVFLRTFKSVSREPDVLYPSLATEKFDIAEPVPLNEVIAVSLPPDAVLFVSLNRFERKKNVGLAVEALSVLKTLLDSSEWEKCHLVLAGGHDDNLLENVEHFKELEQLVDSLQLKEKVTMLKSPSDAAKITLIKSARCLIYTPENEHFGIVPLEAMYLRTAVVAADSGGPTETVRHGVNGYLCPPTPDAFAQALLSLTLDEPLARSMGEEGHRRVVSHFSFESFARRLDQTVKDVMTPSVNS